METVMDLTLDQLDAEIARLRGWDDDGGEARDGGLAWRFTSRTPRHECAHEPEGSGPPAYSRAWALAGPLLEEMAKADPFEPRLERDNSISTWECQQDRADPREFGAGAGYTATEAIARAWLAWKRAQS